MKSKTRDGRGEIGQAGPDARPGVRVLCWANLMTPAEAEEGVCIHLYGSGAPNAHCMGPRCVTGWRWEIFDDHGERLPSGDEPTHGYCALGGRP